MSGSRLISAFGLSVLLFQISAVLSADIVPVVIYGGKPFESPQSIAALRPMSSSEFGDILGSKVGGSRTPILVFAKENLCVEELSQQKSQIDNSDLTYLPSVISPLSTLYDFRSYNVSREDKPDTISDGQLIVVPTSDLNLVPEIYKNIQESNPNFVAIITGVSCSYSRSERIRRAAQTSDDELIVQADRVLLYSSHGIYAKADNNDSYFPLGKPTAYSSVTNISDSVRFDLTFSPANKAEVILRLQFTATPSKYWYFESIEFDYNSKVTTLPTPALIYAPFGFSYHCIKDSIFGNATAPLVNITGIQFQIDPKISSGNNTAVFSDGYDCIGFTTIPIWSGIFITAILGLIMIWALTMILDIRTMDRFDDPKGKTITITATD